jgi:glycosyltransferase involved in cell wall biosynthesis
VGWKRVTDALAAVRLLKRRRPDVRLLRVAQHPMRDVERALAVTDEYHSMLTPPEMASLYRRADVLLLASDATEGFGLPLLEAMACGLSCVVTDIPAFRTFARPDDYSYFAEVGDVQGMAAAVERLLDSPAERERLGVRGLEVAAGYTMRRSCDAMEETLTAIAAGKEERLGFSRPSAA